MLAPTGIPQRGERVNARSAARSWQSPARSGPSDEYERGGGAWAQSWYAIVGFGVLVAAVAVILQWMPENPFSQPSETPHTTRLNAGALTGRDAPMLAVTPSQRAAIAPGCR